MGSAFFGLNIALRGLTAQRQALDVTAHNVSNANTEGYTRQEAVLKSTTDMGWGLNKQIGSGVEVENVRRIRDGLLDKQIRNQLAPLGTWETTERFLEEVESVFNEPSDEGFSSQFSKFWGAWQDLSGSTDSYAARAALVQNASVMADTLRRDYQQLVDVRNRADDEIDSKITEVNGWLSDIAELNQQIANERSVGLDPNDLSDRRDLLLDKVAKALKVHYQEDTDGSITVRLNSSTGALLVQADTSYDLRRNGALGPIQRNDGTGTWADVAPDDGELKAMLELRDTVLSTSSTGSLAYRLNELAKGIITLVNSYHSNGYGYDGLTTGLDFFSGSDASDIAVSGAILADPMKIGAASAASEPGNGEQAITIAQKLLTELAAPPGSATATALDWYNAFISKLGVDTRHAKDMSSNQQLLVDHLKTNRESYSGVSLDEESINLIRFQRAYQASANVMSTIDAMLEKLVNGVGLVGR